jgi:hypothetical protein
MSARCSPTQVTMSDEDPNMMDVGIRTAVFASASST